MCVCFLSNLRNNYFLKFYVKNKSQNHAAIWWQFEGDSQRHVTEHDDTRHYDTQHYDTQYFDTQHYDTQHYDTQHYDTHHYDTQHYDTQHYDTHHYDTHHYDTYEESVVVRIKSNLLLMIFWLHIINYNS